MKRFYKLFLFAFANFFKLNTGTHSMISVPSDFGCVNGLKHGLFRHSNVAACKGTWEGHVRSAGLCSRGWHVCNWNDTDQLSSIGFYQGSHLDGCYAINAAQDDGNCQECNSDTKELGGLGADCPFLYDDMSSCLGKGKVTAVPSHHPGATFQPCTQTPWIDGVVCCKDKSEGNPPVFEKSPNPAVRVIKGSKIVLECLSNGNPAPIVTWYMNGYLVSSNLHQEEVQNGNKVKSTLTIERASSKSDGLYMCKAENKYGSAISYSSAVTSYEPTNNVKACRIYKEQILLYGGLVGACPGIWKGNVRKASKQLCGKGWKVCGLKERETLNKLPWLEVTSVGGCYAYDAVTSDNFECIRCSQHFKGRRMSGIGSDCGMVDGNATSCLRTGRIDVFGSERDVNRRKQTSCSYNSGYTSGVLCCRKRELKRKRVKRCVMPCQKNSHCSKKGTCVCNSSYKLIGDTCQRRGRCPRNLCLNGGRCKNGVCVCPPVFSGVRCEIVRIFPWLVGTSIHSN